MFEINAHKVRHTYFKLQKGCLKYFKTFPRLVVSCSTILSDGKYKKMNSINPNSVRVGDVMRIFLLRMKKEEEQKLIRETANFQRKMDILETDLRWAAGDGDHDKESIIEAEKEIVFNSYSHYFQRNRQKREILDEINARVVRITSRVRAHEN